MPDAAPVMKMALRLAGRLDVHMAVPRWQMAVRRVPTTSHLQVIGPLGSLPAAFQPAFSPFGALNSMSLGRFAALPFVVVAGFTLSACVFDLSSDEPAPRVRAADACPARDEASWAKMQAFLEANKLKDGVKVTESGLQYRVLQAGKETARKPTWASTVNVRYRGTLIDGTVFDETKPSEPPAEFEAGGVIKGWQEALTIDARRRKMGNGGPLRTRLRLQGQGRYQGGSGFGVRDRAAED